VKKLVTATTEIGWLCGPPLANKFVGPFALTDEGMKIFGDEADITYLFKSPEAFQEPFKVTLWIHSGVPKDTPQVD
jgi:hypothetical protein